MPPVLGWLGCGVGLVDEVDVLYIDLDLLIRSAATLFSNQSKPNRLASLHYAMPMKSHVQKFLSERPHESGETIQLGWFIFRIAERGQPPRIETLDFREMASFTDDFSEAERIHSLQTDALGQFEASECPCTLRHFALVSASYSPEREDVFIERQQPADGNDSGWYVGIFDDPRDMDDVTSFTQRSLYELTIHDMRMAPYWLLPPGTIVSLTKDIQFEHPKKKGSRLTIDTSVYGGIRERNAETIESGI